jgi:zinc protease
LQAWHAAEIAPDNMTVYMIGDIDLETATKAVNKAFGKWNAKSKSARSDIGSAQDEQARVVLIDYPGAASSTIVAGRSIAPYNPDTWVTMSIMNRVFGGSFESRLNMNLREDKGWSYGYRSGVSRNLSGDMTLRSSGQVQTDKTADSMQEIKREFDEFVSTRPATANEVDRIKLNRTRSLPRSFATNSGFLGSMISSRSYGLPFDYAESSAERVAAVSLEDVHAAARDIVDSEKLTWLIVGDLEKIEEEVRALDFGEIEVWDAYGNQLR